MTDFNDLHQSAGLATVRAAIDRAVAPDALIFSQAALPEMESNERTIARLARLKLLDYTQVRKDEAKRLHVPVGILDKLVEQARHEDNRHADLFPEVQRWDQPVDGADLLSTLVSTLKRFIVCEEATARAAALWIVMTWLMEGAEVAPMAAITAPEKRCGKTQLLCLMGRLTYRPLAAGNISPAALFRSIELWRPTLLIDEADTFIKDNEELKGVLNCGHTRESAYVLRTVGDDHIPKQFFVWGAKAIAGIGQLPPTLMDRSIPLVLRRKLPSERVGKLRHAEPGLFDALKAKLARWTDDHARVIHTARPAIPDTLHDRAADNWEPLLAIAEAAGGPWPEWAWQTALLLSSEADVLSTGVELLADIRAIFDTRKVSKLSFTELIDALCADEERPWAGWNKGRPISQRQLSKRLSGYGIRSKSVRTDGVNKGYSHDQFIDAFNRYLADPPVSSVTRLQTPIDKGSSVTEAEYATVANPALVTSKPLLDKGCNRVTDETGGSSEYKGKGER